jgi:thiol-disulfide isomerase/thioredoxin
MLFAAVVVGAASAGCATPASHLAALPQRSADPALVARARLEPCPRTAGGRVSGGLPPVTLRCITGRGSVDLAGIRGPALVNIGWSGCAPCGREAPVLQRFSAAAAGRVAVLGVDVEDPDSGLHFAIAAGVHYPMASDPHELVKDAGLVRAYPVTYLVDADGRVAATRYRVYGSVDAVRADVRHYLGVAVP